MLVLSLRHRRLEVVLMFRRQLMRSGTRLYTIVTAVEANAIDRHVVDDGPVVYIGDVDRAHVHDRAIVEECAAAPVTTLKANTGISEPVVDAAIETNVRSPISGVPEVDSIGPSPIAGCP